MNERKIDKLLGALDKSKENIVQKSIETLHRYGRPRDDLHTIQPVTEYD
jgi:hypothetical protein